VYYSGNKLVNYSFFFVMGETLGHVKLLVLQLISNENNGIDILCGGKEMGHFYFSTWRHQHDLSHG
jgi:hypothetical protein